MVFGRRRYIVFREPSGTGQLVRIPTVQIWLNSLTILKIVASWEVSKWSVWLSSIGFNSVTDVTFLLSGWRLAPRHVSSQCPPKVYWAALLYREPPPSRPPHVSSLVRHQRSTQDRANVQTHKALKTIRKSKIWFPGSAPSKEN